MRKYDFRARCVSPGGAAWVAVFTVEALSEVNAWLKAVMLAAEDDNAIEHLELTHVHR